MRIISDKFAGNVKTDVSYSVIFFSKILSFTR